jgi:hypothetical protein
MKYLPRNGNYFSLHRDEETKTALSKPTQTILLQCGDRKSVMILLLRFTKKNNRRCTKTETRLRDKQFKRQLDSKRKQEGDGFPRAKKLTRRV